MVKHIVLWKLKESAEGRTKQQNAALLKQELEALKEKIPVIDHIEVGINFNNSEAAFDLVLCLECKTANDLRVYQYHPEHLKVAELAGRLRESRVVADYQV